MKEERPDLFSYFGLTILFWICAYPLGIVVYEIPYVWILGINGVLLFSLWSGFLDAVMGEGKNDYQRDEEMTIFKDSDGNLKIKKK